jgi:hypothetical protein
LSRDFSDNGFNLEEFNVNSFLAETVLAIVRHDFELESDNKSVLSIL